MITVPQSIRVAQEDPPMDKKAKTPKKPKTAKAKVKGI